MQRILMHGILMHRILMQGILMQGILMQGILMQGILYVKRGRRKLKMLKQSVEFILKIKVN